MRRHARHARRFGVGGSGGKTSLPAPEEKRHTLDEVTTVNKMKRDTICIVTYWCRDIGYGVERGTVRACWTGEVDAWGKLTIEVLSGRRKMFYLFADEIQRVRAISRNPSSK